MRLCQLAANVTLIETEKGSSILFSYETPVAVSGTFGGKFRRTKVGSSPSRTTAKHLSQHARGYEPVDDTEFRTLLEEA
jgi:hypothetical protein